MNSPSALTEHVSPNLAGIFLLDPVVITYLNLGDTDSEASDPPSSNGTRVLSSSSNTENEFLKFYMGVSNIRKFFFYLT